MAGERPASEQDLVTMLLNRGRKKQEYVSPENQFKNYVGRGVSAFSDQLTDMGTGFNRGMGETVGAAFDVPAAMDQFARGRENPISGRFSQYADQNNPEPTTALGRIARGVGSDAIPIAGVAALTGGGSLVPTATEMGLGFLGDIGARTAEEYGGGELAQAFADVAASASPSMLAKGALTNLAAVPLAAVTRRAEESSLRHAVDDLTPNTTRRLTADRAQMYLTPDELALMGPKDLDLIERRLQTAATPDEVVAMAAAGASKRGWYRASAKAIVDVFGEDADRFAALLSATSPQTSVESNLRNALHIWKNWTAAGRPEDPGVILKIIGDSVEGDKGVDSALGAWVNNTTRAFTKGDVMGGGLGGLSGPKVNSFMLNLRGHMKEVTQDTHMGRGLGMDQMKDFAGRTSVKKADSIGKLGYKKPGYLAGNILVREAAEKMTQLTGETWTPAEIQETVWSWVKAHTDHKKKLPKDVSIMDLMEQGVITEDHIRDTADFATLFSGQNEFHNILEEAGYGERIKTLDHPGFGAGGTIGGRAGPSGALRSAAERVDRASRTRGAGTGESFRQLNQRTSGILRPPNSSGGEPSAFRVRSRRTGAGVLAGKPIKMYSLPDKVKKEYKDHGVPTPTIHEFSDAVTFHKAISDAKASTKFGAAVHVYDVKDYAGMRTFMTSDGSAGFALKPDGDDWDIVSVFNNANGKHKGISPYLIGAAMSQGGNKLDAYNIKGGLRRIYSDAGFDEIPEKRQKWDPRYQPDDWDEETLGTPDVIYMRLGKAPGMIEGTPTVQNIKKGK